MGAGEYWRRARIRERAIRELVWWRWIWLVGVSLRGGRGGVVVV